MSHQLKKLLITKDKTIKQAMKEIDHGGLQIAFVVDKNQKLIGVITDGDIRRALLSGVNLEKTIDTIMNKSPLSVVENWDRNEIKALLKTEKSLTKFGVLIPTHEVIKIPILDKQNRIIDIAFVSDERCEFYIKDTEKVKDKIKPVNKILVVGGAGYLGSILCRKLLKRGYYVRVLDNLTYGDQGIKELYGQKNFEFIKGDMRNIQTVVDAVKDMDAVVHLAAIVGDHASELDPEETIEINYFGTRMLSEVCKYSQINRLLFASTCSVYGASPTPDTRIDENSSLNPVSLYAEMKLKSEKGILELKDENFSPTILRMATLYGLSPRMRFDLVVNTLTIKAMKDKEFTIFGGEQWRPNLHVDDAAEAYIKCLEAPIDKIKGEIFNVGSNQQNFKIIEIGETIKSMIPEADMSVDRENVDKRNYNVLFDEITTHLNYKTNISMDKGIKEMIDAIEKGMFDDYTDSKYSNYRSLQDYYME